MKPRVSARKLTTRANKCSFPGCEAPAVTLLTAKSPIIRFEASAACCECEDHQQFASDKVAKEAENRKRW